MQIDLPESTEGDPGSFVHFPVVLGQGRGGKLSFLQYDQLFARTTAAQFDEAGKETRSIVRHIGHTGTAEDLRLGLQVKILSVFSPLSHVHRAWTS